MLSKVVSAGLNGVEAYRVEVEVDVHNAIPSFSVVGLPDGAVKESRDRVRAALNNSGYALPQSRVTVNLAPADVKKEGSGFDLPMALAVLAADGVLEDVDLSQTLIVGELALDGSVRQVRGALSIAIDAARMGVKNLIIPRANGVEAAVVDNVESFVADSLSQLVEGLRAKNLERVSANPWAGWEERISSMSVDFADVRGQGHAKRAMEVAAAGGHNLLMVGPPGTGKTMLARRLPSILPEMGREEAIETSRVYSVAGLLGCDSPLITERPFRAPHHTVSDAGLIGGGAQPRPGEITLSHNGVLFLDELPEFKRNVLDLLRQPLEDGQVTIVRASGAVSYPARFMLVGAMNPCPCGYLGDPKKQCTCSQTTVEKYSGRISGPLLDRFDLRVEVPAVQYADMTATSREEPSSDIRRRVVEARALQAKRLKGSGFYSNSQMSAKAVREFCVYDASAGAVLERAMEKMSLSARGFNRTLKLARTIADLDGSRGIEKKHVLEALQFRLHGQSS